MLFSHGQTTIILVQDTAYYVQTINTLGQNSKSEVIKRESEKVVLILLYHLVKGLSLVISPYWL